MHKNHHNLLFPEIHDFNELFDEIGASQGNDPYLPGHYYCSGLPGDLEAVKPGIFRHTSAMPKPFLLDTVLRRIAAGPPSFEIEADNWLTRDRELNPGSRVLILANQRFASGMPFISLVDPNTIPGYIEWVTQPNRASRQAQEVVLRWLSTQQEN